jgi:hypothetical protein
MAPVPIFHIDGVLCLMFVLLHLFSESGVPGDAVGLTAPDAMCTAIVLARLCPC